MPAKRRRVTDAASEAPADAAVEPDAADDPAYATANYWDERYREGSSLREFEWYCGYDALKPLIEPLLRTQHPAAADTPDEAGATALPAVLEIGCGDRPLTRDMRADGFRGALTSIDFAPALIRQLRADERERALPRGDSARELTPAPSTAAARAIRFEQMDARELAYAAGSFDLVLDKVRKSRARARTHEHTCAHTTLHAPRRSPRNKLWILLRFEIHPYTFSICVLVHWPCGTEGRRRSSRVVTAGRTRLV